MEVVPRGGDLERLELAPLAAVVVVRGVVDDDGTPMMETVDDLDDDGNIVMIANPNVATAWPDPVE